MYRLCHGIPGIEDLPRNSLFGPSDSGAARGARALLPPAGRLPYVPVTIPYRTTAAPVPSNPKVLRKRTSPRPPVPGQRMSFPPISDNLLLRSISPRLRLSSTACQVTSSKHGVVRVPARRSHSRFLSSPLGSEEERACNVAAVGVASYTSCLRSQLHPHCPPPEAHPFSCIGLPLRESSIHHGAISPQETQPSHPPGSVP